MPLGRSPTTGTPRDERSSSIDTAMPTMTAMRVAGALFETDLRTRMMARHSVPTANAHPLNRPSFRPSTNARSCRNSDSPGTEKPQSFAAWLTMMVIAMPCR